MLFFETQCINKIGRHSVYSCTKRLFYLFLSKKCVFSGRVNCWSKCNVPARGPDQWLGLRRTRPTTGQFCPLPAADLQQQNTTFCIADVSESCSETYVH